MTPRGRSYVILGATLLIGMVLGAVLVGALGQFRAGRIEGMRHEDRFVRDMERILQPRDDGQAEALRPILEQTAARNQEIMANFDTEMRAALEALIADLEPLLDEDQLERMRRFAERPPPGPGGPGRRPRPKKR